jgi:hypothetical protein
VHRNTTYIPLPYITPTHRSDRKKIFHTNNMKITLTTITALVAPIIAQSTTPAPTTTDAWYGSGPPWASSDPAKWSSIYNSLLSEGKIPSTLTAAPWPTGSWGPGQGPWGGPGNHDGPGGHGGPGGPGGPGGRHWGGTLSPHPTPPISHLTSKVPKKKVPLN